MTNAIYPLNEPELDVDSRPLPDPLTVLRKFRDFYVRTETAYREFRYLLLGTVYAEALRIFDSVEGLKRFYEEEYWRGRSYRQPRGIRDVFRDVCAYVTNATDTEGAKPRANTRRSCGISKMGECGPSMRSLRFAALAVSRRLLVQAYVRHRPSIPTRSATTMMMMMIGLRRAKKTILNVGS